MKYELIIEALNEKNINEVKVVTADGNETIVSNKDSLQRNGEYIVVKRNDEEISLCENDIVEIRSIKKSPNAQIRSFKRSGQKNRH